MKNMTMKKVGKSTSLFHQGCSPLHILPLEKELRTERDRTLLSEGRIRFSFPSLDSLLRVGDGDGEVLDS